ncbi:MAG: Na/Pi symporter [Bacteroidales bacterium]
MGWFILVIPMRTPGVILLCLLCLPAFQASGQTIRLEAENGENAPWAFCSQAAEEPLRVRVVDAQGAGQPSELVLFQLAGQPDGAKGASLSPASAYTDSLGWAGVTFTAGSEPGTYTVSCRMARGFPDNEVLLPVKVRSKHWAYFLVMGLLGGLGLFLFGMNTMSEGLQKSAGEKLRGILDMVTRNRLSGAAVGTVVTTVIQSSSATSVMLVSFVNAGLLQFRQTLPVLLGAALGTTITAQIIAFKITEYSLLLVAAGFFVNAFSRKQQGKAVGSALFGFGVLFFGMEIMSDAMAPLRSWEPFLALLLRLETPALGIAAGFLFTALIQSSSAFIGILIVMASQGLITLDAAIPLVLGSNLGTPVTALLSSLKSGKEAKKVALAFFLLKFFSVLIFAFWTDRMALLLRDFAPEAALTRTIANAHTVVNIVLMAVMLPLTPQVAALVDRIVGVAGPETRPVLQVRYLDRSTLSAPSLALALVKQEILGMGHEVLAMFRKILDVFLKKDPAPLSEIYRKEQEVNYLRDAIKSYLLELNQGAKGAKELEASFQMLYATEEFEKIADLISGNLASRAEKWLLKDYRFSEEGRRDLETYHEKVAKQLERALEVFGEANLQKAALMKSKHKSYRSLSHDLEKQHYARIMEGIAESVQSSKTHLEILTLFSNIDSRATNIARVVLEWNRKPGKKQKPN